MTNLDLNELRATYDHPADKSVIELIDRLEQAEQELAGYKTREALSEPIDFDSLERAIKAEQQVEGVREIAKADLKCPCCSGYEEIIRALDGEQGG